MEDLNSASAQGRFTTWRLRLTTTLAGSRRRKMATAAALMLVSLAVFDPSSFDGTQRASTTNAENMSEDEFEQIEAMLAELERSPDLKQGRAQPDSATANANSSGSQRAASGTLLIPDSAGDPVSEPPASLNQGLVAATDAGDLRSEDAPFAVQNPRIPAAAQGVSYTGAPPNATGDRAPRIRLTGTIDPL